MAKYRVTYSGGMWCDFLIHSLYKPVLQGKKKKRKKKKKPLSIAFVQKVKKSAGKKLKCYFTVAANILVKGFVVFLLTAF